MTSLLPLFVSFFCACTIWKETRHSIDRRPTMKKLMRIIMNSPLSCTVFQGVKSCEARRIIWRSKVLPYNEDNIISNGEIQQLLLARSIHEFPLAFYPHPQSPLPRCARARGSLNPCAGNGALSHSWERGSRGEGTPYKTTGEPHQQKNHPDRWSG